MSDTDAGVAVIRHGPWTLIDVTNAGANWVDEEVHVDRYAEQAA